MKEIVNGEFPTPPILHIYPTNECNNECKFCIMKEERDRGGSLTREVFEEIIYSANFMGIKCIHISGGGEPTLYEHLDLIEGFKGYKVLSTNGRELTRKTADMFDRIRISINAGSSEIYEQVNGTKDFWKLDLRLIQLAKKPRSYQLGLGFVADANNWIDIPRACVLGDSLDMDFIHIRPAYYTKGTKDEKLVQLLGKSISLISDSCKDAFKIPIYSINDKFEGYWTDKTYSKCRATPLHAVVTATGELSVCQDVFIKFGNLYTSSLEEIWQSKAHHEAIAKIDIDKCPRCVMNKANEVMEHVIINNEVRSELL